MTPWGWYQARKAEERLGGRPVPFKLHWGWKRCMGLVCVSLAWPLNNTEGHGYGYSLHLIVKPDPEVQQTPAITGWVRFGYLWGRDLEYCDYLLQAWGAGPLFLLVKG